MAIPIDLRSDTVTQPTDAMKLAMVQAPLGDDVLGDDPTVNRLQEQCAELFGKDAACFVPSGSMANQIAIRAQTSPGDEIMCHEHGHVYLYEAGAWAAISGCSLAMLRGERGQFESHDVSKAVRMDDPHFPRSRLLVVENTQNRGGGAIWPIDRIHAVTDEARKHDLKCHLDGARIWNASAATHISVADYAQPFDTVSACFSKGLGCPVGSIVCGDQDTIAQAHRIRKMLGGTMRQSGMLAAAAIHAIDHHRDRLCDDHTHAKMLAETLERCRNAEIDAESVETNIVYFDVQDDAAQIAAALDCAGLRCLDAGPRTLRLVTSLAVDRADIEQACTILTQLLDA
ncbi:MAG: aminotransferase class I/II-fold pyridoxal phosphate-dependent enzyme [Planctomycetes bacterium]|jgi:threonine aldolase|nr:aminotransferase class I/II-fold pyridoxal phosphate-dependent enzyme [Planctomycetota bacterium]MCP4840086.1 aminotransferase class I/II-fold pyridoxal phosphate-dependent enzyme [Planctomycetota bacterium]